jgi:hypothetical protein
MTPHPPVLASHVVALSATQAASQSPSWLQVIQAVGAIATTIGVLTALYIAAIRDPRKDAAERNHHAAQISELRAAERERIAAQARRVVPTCHRTPMFGDNWWTVRIDNTSNSEATLLAVSIAAVDANGLEVPNGCRVASNTMSIEDAFDRSVRAALADMSRGGFENQLVPAFKHAIRDELIGHIVARWPRSLPPHQHAVMAYTTTEPDYRLRISIEYEDEAGFQWRRTDTSPPTRREPQ